LISQVISIPLISDQLMDDLMAVSFCVLAKMKDLRLLVHVGLCFHSSSIA